MRPCEEGPVQQVVNRQGIKQHTNEQHQELAQIVAADWHKEIMAE